MINNIINYVILFVSFENCSPKSVLNTSFEKHELIFTQLILLIQNPILTKWKHHPVPN